jgi:hypothetical protein
VIGLAYRALADEIAATCAVFRDAQEQDELPDPTVVADPAVSDAPAAPRNATLDALCTVFGLTTFERAVLVVCAGIELDGETSATIVAASGQPYLTFGLALAALSDPHWSAITPAGPLRRWRLVEPEVGPSITAARLRIDERILHLLAGVSYLDPRVDIVVEELAAPATLAPSHQSLADRVADVIAADAWPRVQLTGPSPGAEIAIATTACALAGRRAYRLRLADLPRAPRERLDIQRILEREAILEGATLILDPEDEEDDAARDAAARFVLALQAGCLVVGREPLPGLTDATRIDVPEVPSRERQALVRDTLGAAWSGALNGQLDALAAQFDLDAIAVAAAGREADLSADGDPADRLWDACRIRARPRLEDLAERIVSTADWDDLVLAEPGREALGAIAAQVRWRGRVYDDWGFAARGSRGLGISALFAGPSGTGKTMAAEVLSNELRLDLFRIDLSSVVSKYIGETEKNLRRVFDAADRGSAVLLFDEADALFGRRTEVKDSHDRFANIEVSYLLQRMEAYRGLAILTTNRRDAIDDAFLRRIRFVVEFPFPDARQRTEIWRRAFPASVPRNQLDLEALAGLTVAGGNIRNIALGAAFLAADESAPVGMPHLRRAARTEYAKLERPLSSVELAG